MPNDSDDSVLFNFTKSIVDKAAIDELNKRENEFFNKDMIEEEIEIRLKALCTDIAIEAEVRRTWLLDPKKKDRIRVSKPEKQLAESSIRQRNKIKVKLTVIGICEDLYFKKYNIHSEYKSN